jgi:RNA polymerase sigma-32 factor
MAHLDDTLTQADNLRYIRGTMQAPLLEKDDEFALATAWRERGDEKALHRLIKAYARLVVATAARFRAYGLPMGDLMQEGHIGLLQAANRFDVSRDVRFSTYATWWIRASIQDYVLRNWSIVRTGTTAAQKSLFFNLRRLRAKIAGKNNGQSMTESGLLPGAARQEIAEALHVNVADVEFMDQRLSARDHSLNMAVHEDGTSDFQDFLVDHSPNPEEATMEKMDSAVRQDWLKAALQHLDAREQRIIRERHLSEEAATLDDLGRALHISKERVRQLEARALGKLKGHIENHMHDEKDLVAA